MGKATGAAQERKKCKVEQADDVSAKLDTARNVGQGRKVEEMTAKWLVLGVLAILTALWIVYAALKAFNGIVYELTLTKAYLNNDEKA